MHNFLQITNENKSNFIGNMKIEDIIMKTQSADWSWVQDLKETKYLPLNWTTLKGRFCCLYEKQTGLNMNQTLSLPITGHLNEKKYL